MKIAIIESNTSIAAGGAESSMAAFSDFMIKSGFNIYFICEKKGEYSFEGLKACDSLVINMQPPQIQGIASYFKNIYSVASFIRKNKIDLLLTHTIHTFPIIRLVKMFTRCKSVVYFKWIYNGEKIGLLNKWGLNGMSRVIYINKYVADYWRPFLPNDFNICLIPDGVKMPIRTYGQSKIAAKKILYIGRIYEGKGLHILIHALCFLDADIQLDVAGYYSITDDHVNLKYHKYINELIVKYELSTRITFHGYLSEFEYLYKTSELVAVPSVLPDAQPLVILEAMARKKLVIGSQIGGIPEILTGDLANFLFVPDAVSLAKKIQSVFGISNEEKRNLEEKLFDRFKDVYEISKTHNKLKEVICNL